MRTSSALPLDERPLCRRTVERLAAALPDELDLVTLAEARDQVRFTNRLLAALHRGRSVAASVLVAGASLLDDPLLIAVTVARVEGDVDAAAVGAMVDHRVVATWSSASLLFCTVCRLQREGRAASRALVRWMKWVARRSEDQETFALLVALAELTDEPSLRTVLDGRLAAAARDQARELADWLVGAFTGEVMAVVPELPVAPPRVGEKVGRNDKCPCGSGKKFKKCCEGKAVAATPQTAADLQSVPVPALARLDPLSVPASVREAVARDLMHFGEFAAGARWADASANGPDVRALGAELLCTLDRGDEARALVEGLAPQFVPVELDVLGTTPARGVKALEKLAVELIDGAPATLALAALASPFPALAVAMARGVLVDPEVDPESRQLVFAALHDRRDREGWWPWDRAASWPLGEEAAPDEDVLQKHVDARRHAEAAYAKVERERARLEGELARTRAKREASPVRTAEEQAEAELRGELARLKADHKRVHAERNALRRELRELAELDAVEAEDVAPAGAEEEEEVDDEVAAAMGVRVPELPEGFAEVLARVPVATRRTTMQRLGELCSGRQAGWRDTKRLLGFDNLWRVRIGRSYRLLYRVGDTTLQVVDLVHRQELEKKLNKLQALR